MTKFFLYGYILVLHIVLEMFNKYSNSRKKLNIIMLIVILFKTILF